MRHISGSFVLEYIFIWYDFQRGKAHLHVAGHAARFGSLAQCYLDWTAGNHAVAFGEAQIVPADSFQQGALARGLITHSDNPVGQRFSFRQTTTPSRGIQQHPPESEIRQGRRRFEVKLINLTVNYCKRTPVSGHT
jgi:hypothetical protein